MFYVAVSIPFPEEKQLEIWWDIAKYGYNFAYEGGCVKLYGRRKSQDEIDFLKEKLQKYSDYEFHVEDNDL